MRWVERRIEAPADVVWAILTDVQRWPEWGPTVRRAHLDAERLAPRATGWVETPVRLRLPFRVTDVDEGRRWTWRVAGIPATDHRVDPIDAGSCRLRLGVPTPALPYLAVCHVALRRIEALVTARRR